MKLLIVNDEVIAVQGMLQAIDWSGIGIDEVRSAYDAALAKEILLSGWRPDIILCDIEMPGENGIELLGWIAERNMEMEKLILTCHADFEFAQQAVRLGCRDYILTPAPYEAIEEKVRECISAVDEKKKDKDRIHYGDLWLSDHAQPKNEDSSFDAVNQAEAYIYEHLSDKNLTVSRLAEISAFNADYLNRIFKKQKGISIRQFIMDERMRLAKLRLEEGGYLAVQVAEMVGYDNYPSFAASFKNYYGASPTDFTKEQGKE